MRDPPDPHLRDLYVDRERKARAVAEHLRLVAGRHPDDPLLASLIGELTIESPECATLWAGHHVRTCDLAVHELRRPLAEG